MGKAGPGRVDSLGLANWSNVFSGLWVIRVVPSCLTPEPGRIKAERYFLQRNPGQREEVTLDWLVCIQRHASGWVLSYL